MATGMVVGQKINAVLSPKCSQGTSSGLNGTPTWESSNTSKAIIESTSNGGLGAVIEAVGAGTCTITATCVGQNGNIVKTIDLNITAQYATVVDLKVSTPY